MSLYENDLNGENPYLSLVFLTLSPALVVGDVESGQRQRVGRSMTKHALTKAWLASHSLHDHDQSRDQTIQYLRWPKVAGQTLYRYRVFELTQTRDKLGSDGSEIEARSNIPRDVIARDRRTFGAGERLSSLEASPSLTLPLPTSVRCDVWP
jgi:hypothetical protein